MRLHFNAGFLFQFLQLGKVSFFLSRCFSNTRGFNYFTLRSILMQLIVCYRFSGEFTVFLTKRLELNVQCYCTGGLLNIFINKLDEGIE